MPPAPVFLRSLPSAAFRSSRAAPSLRAMATSSSSSPAQREPLTVPPPTMEAAIRSKLEDLLKPTLLEIRNDSSKHARHAPMQEPGAYTGETHFAIHAQSALFANKTRIARHRLVNDALKDEFARGLHALSLRLETEDGGAK